MLHLQGISKQYGSKILFENADGVIDNRSRLALIGPNGAGKSTLVRIVMGFESPDSGMVTRANGLSIGYLAQEVPKFSGRTILEEVMRMDGRREELLEARAELERKFANHGTSDEGLEADLERYGRLAEELDHLDEYRLESRAQEILMGMGFRQTDWHRKLTEFSGGWLMRVALARILLMDPDLLLLDEPTNHLDLESLLWLEEFLKSFRGAMLLISHDTEFLNRIVDQVWEIDQRKVWSYRGNLDAYVVQKEERLTVLRAQYHGQQAKIAELEGFIERFGAKATKARQAQSRQKQLDKMDLIELPDDKQTVRFRFPPAPHSGREVVTLKRAELSYGPKRVFKDLDWIVRRGARIAIVGVNGAGKTTLLKMLAGEIEPTGGDVKLGHLVQVGYYAQHQAESLDLNKTIQQELELTAPDLPISRIRGIAGAFLFQGDAVDKKCRVLSGGEKARVALAKLLLTPSNFLMLDEPTNHLDIESRGVLLEALQDYEGTLCLVSHDRSFMSSLVDTVLEITPEPGGSRVVQLVEGYEDYLARKTREAAQSMKAGKLKTDDREPAKSTPVKAPSAVSSAGSSSTVPVPAPSVDAAMVSNNKRKAWEKERIQLEADITRHESEKSVLETRLADQATYEDKPLTLRLLEEQRGLEKMLNEKLSRWEELCIVLGV